MADNCGNCGNGKQSASCTFCLLFGIFIRSGHEGCRYHTEGKNDEVDHTEG